MPHFGYVKKKWLQTQQGDRELRTADEGRGRKTSYQH